MIESVNLDHCFWASCRKVDENKVREYKPIDDDYQDRGARWNSEFGLAPDDDYGYWLAEQMANDD